MHDVEGFILFGNNLFLSICFSILCQNILTDSRTRQRYWDNPVALGAELTQVIFSVCMFLLFPIFLGHPHSYCIAGESVS